MAATIAHGMCRCCASEGSYKDFRSVYHWMGEQEVYGDMLQECLDITLSTSENGNNGGICELCITQLRNASNFKKQVLRTEQQFLQMVRDNALKLDVDVKLEHEHKDVFDSQDSDHDVTEEFCAAVEFEAPPIKEEEEIEESDGPKTRKRAAKASTSKAKKAKKEAGETSTKSCLIDQNSSMLPTCKSGSVGSISVKQFASTENIRSSEITTTCLKKALENIALIRYKKNTENKTDSSKTLLLSQFAHVKDNLAVADHDHNYSIRLLPPLREKHNDSVGTRNDEPSKIYQNITTSEDAVVNVLEDNEFNEIIKRKSTSPLNLSPNRTDRESGDDGSSSSETHLVAVHYKNINYEYEDGKNDPDYKPYFKTKANSVITLAPKMIVRKDNCTNIPLMNDDETPYWKFNKECAVIFRSSNVTPLFMSSGVGFLCAYCNERFLIAANLKFHTINSHVKPESKRTNLKRTFSNSFFIRVDITNIKCKLCEITVDSLNFLINHLNSAHNKNIDPEMAQKLVPFVFKSTKYVCCLCTLELFSFKQLSMHTIKEHFRNYICDLCNESFVVKNMLTKHMRTHQKEKSLHTCDLCQRSFRQMSTLTSHKLSVHSIGTKPQLPCHVCNEVFDTRKKRTGHLEKIHNIGTKTLSCEICKKIFSQTSGLKKHIDSVHLGKKWPCEICGKQLAHQGGLYRHLARHESSDKKFQCDVCKKFYSTKPNLADHMTIHTKQFKFQCEQCGQKFRQNIALKNHRKSKHENNRCVIKKRKKKT